MLWRVIGYGGHGASGLLLGACLRRMWPDDLSCVQFGICLMSLGLGSLFSLWGRETLDERQMKIYGLLGAHLLLPLAVTFVAPLNICVALLGFCVNAARSSQSLILKDAERNLSLSALACYVLSPLEVLAGVLALNVCLTDQRALLFIWTAAMLSLVCWSLLRWRAQTPWNSRDGAVSLWTDLSAGGRTERLLDDGAETPRGRMRSAVSTLFRSVVDQYSRARENPSFRISVLGAVVSALKVHCLLWTPYLLTWPPLPLGWPPLDASSLFGGRAMLVVSTTLFGLFIGRCLFAIFRDKFEDILYRDEVMTASLVVAAVGLALMALLPVPWGMSGLLLLCMSVAHVDPVAHTNAWLFNPRNWFEMVESLLNVLLPMTVAIIAQTASLRAAYCALSGTLLAALLLFHYLPLATEKALMMSTLTMDVAHHDHEEALITFTHL